MRFGVQLFGVAEQSKNQQDKLFQHLHESGYRHVEPCIAFGEIDGFEKVIWTEEELKAFTPALEKHKLEVSSCHVFAKNLLSMLPRLCDMACQYKLTDIVVPCPNYETKEAYEHEASILSTASDALRSVGTRLLIHNGSAELLKYIDGITAYEWLVRNSGDHVGMQIDVGWLAHAGEDVERFLWRNKDIIHSIHYKDVRGDHTQYSEAQCNAVIGDGIIPLTACFQFARAQGISQIVDQDMSDGDILDDLALAYQRISGLTNTRECTDSELCTLDTQTGEVKIVYQTQGIIEAPNWLSNGDMIFNGEGHLYRMDYKSGAVVQIDTGRCNQCNNDHVISPDEKFIAISNNDSDGSRIYILPITGGEPICVVDKPHSYLHGWSPDGKELSYCAFRPIDDEMTVDIYTVSIHGGDERRITDGIGYNDGAEYAPDGKTIWFNSTRSGLMQIHQVACDGSEQKQLTTSNANNWFGHVSPDGKKVVYISYRKGELDPAEHLPNMRVSLWIMDVDGNNQRKLLDLFGGQGTINVNSWNQDNRHIAFVQYRLNHK